MDSLSNMFTEKDKFINYYFGKKFNWEHPDYQKQQIVYIKLVYLGDNLKWEVLKNGKVKVEFWDFKIEGNDVYIGRHLFYLSILMGDVCISSVEWEKCQANDPKGK